jgi:hypothetical protein
MQKIDFKNLDKKSKIEIAVTSVMAIVLVLILSNSLRVIFGPKIQPAPVMSAGAFKEVIRRDIQSSIFAQNAQTAKSDTAGYDKAWGRDPFSPKVGLRGTEIAVSDLKLEGILWKQGRQSKAIINGEVISEGEAIGNLTVLSIEKESVVVTDGEKKYKLQLW